MKLNRIGLSLFRNGRFKKYFLIMRLTSLLILVLTLQMSASVWSQTMNVKLKNSTLQELFVQIEKSSNYRFFYNNDEVDVNQKISIDVEEKTVGKILTDVLEGTPYSFREMDNKLILIERAGNGTNFSGTGSQQQKSIRGTVKSATGESLPGVSVVVKGTSNGTITDTNGSYTVSNIPPNSTLLFSFVGMKTQEVAVGNKPTIDVVLLEEAIGLEEVVAVGYGTQKKVTISGSIVSITPQKLTEISTVNLSNSIAGQLPGVVVNSPGGDAGADEATVLIRGKGTLGNSDALIVIDGIPDRGGFSRLNPQDIESFTVLKDASAAIYGARAANGVILITTKRGKTGKPVISASTNVIFSQPTIKTNPLDSWQEATLANESKFSWENPQWSKEQIQLLKDQSKPLQYPNTDWMGILLKDWTSSTNNTVSISGGAERIRYFLSGQYLQQNGILKGYSYPYKQSSMRANVDVDIIKSLTLGLDILNRYEDRNYSQLGSDGLWRYARSGGRSLVSYFPDGRVGKGFQPGEFNAAETVSPRAGYTRSDDNILNTKVTLNWNTPVKGLTLSAYGAFDSKSNSYKQFKNIWDEWLYDYATNTYSKAVDATKRLLQESKADYSTKTYNVKLNYKKSIGDHNVDAFVAYEQSRFEMTYLIASRQGIPSDKLVELFTGESAGQYNSGKSEANGRINYFGRVNYDYKGKYLATFSLRRDGSQNFAPGKRYGIFPGLSLGWRISEEPFLKGIDVIDNLKIRGSWGKMGNDNVDPFQYLSSYAFTDYAKYGWGVMAGYDFGNGMLPGIFESTVANKNITWETSTTTNIGMEGSLFKSLLNFDFDYFTSKREGILIARNASVPQYTGLALPDENLGRVNNSGFEIQLSTHKKLNKDLSFDVSANMSYAHNKVVFYDEAAGVKNYQKVEGRPIDSYLVWEAVGIYKTQAEIDATPHGDAKVTAPGDLQIKDQNGDGIINNDDRIRFDYSNIPQIVYGINLGLSYKNFDLSALFQGQAKAYVLLKAPLGEDKQYFDNRWGNGESLYPRINVGSTGTYGSNSTFWLRKADFLRFKNVSLAYNVPEKVLANLKISNLQLYVRGNNLFLLFDKIEGKWRDPEGDYDRYPIQRSWQFGLKLGF